MSTNTTTTSAEQRLKELGITLPRPPTPLGAYVAAVQSGNLLFLSGTLPVEGGVPNRRDVPNAQVHVSTRVILPWTLLPTRSLRC
jgi:enamine deaminase RidA (YjgF/YER057c/UK114 family)